MACTYLQVKKMELEQVLEWIEIVRNDGNIHKSLFALKSIEALVKSVSTEAECDALAQHVVRPLVECLASNKSNACIELTADCLKILIEKSSPEIAKQIANMITPTVIPAIDTMTTEEARLSVAELICVASSHHRYLLVESVTPFLQDNAPSVRQAGLLTCLSPPFPDTPQSAHSLLSHTLPLLRDKRSQHRLLALRVVDKFMRWKPWEFTYPLIALLLAKSRDQVSVADFFNPATAHQTNYAACLSFDANVLVRTSWFSILVEWSTTLPDKADVEIHFIPYILTGINDQSLDVRRNVMQRVNEKFTVTSEKEGNLSEEAKSWLRVYVRKFIKAFLHETIDFDNYSPNRSISMLALICSILGSHVAEHAYDLMETLIRFTSGGPIEREAVVAVETILSVIGNEIDANVWWSVLSVGGMQKDNKWYILNHLLAARNVDVPITVGVEITASLINTADASVSTSNIATTLYAMDELRPKCLPDLTLALLLHSDGRLVGALDIPTLEGILNQASKLSPQAYTRVVSRLMAESSWPPECVENMREHIIGANLAKPEPLIAWSRLDRGICEIFASLINRGKPDTVLSVIRGMSQEDRDGLQVSEAFIESLINVDRIEVIATLKSRLSQNQIRRVVEHFIPKLSQISLNETSTSAFIDISRSITSDQNGESTTLVLTILEAIIPLMLDDPNSDSLPTLAQHCLATIPAQITTSLISQWDQDGYIGRSVCLSRILPTTTSC